ncbi:MAG: hypothetical protein M5U26_20990 [Planctomycetota bacterium]|nr:hypothetical protein [Planctomycetota bacterium]
MNTILRRWISRKNGRADRGTALIVAMVIVLLLAGLATSLLMEMQVRSKRVEADSEDAKAFEAAEAGLDWAMRDLNTGGTGTIGIGWNGDTNGNGLPDDNEVQTGGWHVSNQGTRTANPNGPWGCDGAGFYPVTDPRRPKTAAFMNQFRQKDGTVKRNPRPEPAEFDFYTHSRVFGDVRFYTYAISWENDGIDNDGNGLIDGNDPDNERLWYTIYATGFSNPATPDGKFITVEAIARKVVTQNKLILDAALELQVNKFQGNGP